MLINQFLEINFPEYWKKNQVLQAIHKCDMQFSHINLLHTETDTGTQPLFLDCH